MQGKVRRREVSDPSIRSLPFLCQGIPPNRPSVSSPAAYLHVLMFGVLYARAGFGNWLFLYVDEYLSGLAMNLVFVVDVESEHEN